MTHRVFPRFLFASLLGLGFASAPALAADPAPGVLRMDDSAGFFSAAGARAGKDRLAEVTFKGPTHYGVATFREIPESKKAQFDAVKNDANRRNAFFADWARELAKSKDNHGDVFTLIFWNGKAYRVSTVVDRESDIHRGFNDSRAEAVTKEFTKVLTIANEAKQTPNEVHPEMNTALLAAIEHIIGDLQDTAAPDAVKRGATRGTSKASAGSGIMSYVCLGICVLLGVWLVIGLIRMFTGGGGGGGMGGGGMGGGYGGGMGGGGMFGTFLGGMLGAAAGMYLYNNVFGGHSESAMAGDSYGDSGATDTGDGDYAGGAEGGDGGGDWGDDNRNDTGGGDWGDSGGDAGGGGDWGGDAGGGGGDFGGGGDW